jgi:DNA-binding response OmpR family regulator
MSNHRIMIVDDEPDLPKMVEMYLKAWHFEIDAFSDPVKALGSFQQNPAFFSLVLTDVRMPGMSGFELCRKVKNERPEAPVILMTSFEINPSEFAKVLPHTTVDGFIAKPFHLKELKKLISQFTS